MMARAGAMSYQALNLDNQIHLSGAIAPSTPYNHVNSR